MVCPENAYALGEKWAKESDFTTLMTNTWLQPCGKMQSLPTVTGKGMVVSLYESGPNLIIG